MFWEEFLVRSGRRYLWASLEVFFVFGLILVFESLVGKVRLLFLCFFGGCGLCVGVLGFGGGKILARTSWF